jgi:hypothetical protein
MPDYDDLIRSGFQQLAGAQLPVPSASAVVRRGTQRRRRTRGTQAVSAVAAVVIIAVGSGHLAGRGTTARQSAASPGRHEPALCTAARSARLAGDLKRSLPTMNQDLVMPIALSPSGATVYVQTDRPGFRGIAAENVATGATVVPILPLPLKDMGDAVGAVGPAGSLIWTDMISNPGNLTVSWTPMHVWSPRTRTVTELEPSGQSGGALSAPVFVDGQVAAWLQADGRRREVVEANVTTGVVRVIASGYLGAPVLVGHALVWPASSTPTGRPSRLVASKAGVFPAEPVAVPAALRSAGSTQLIASSGLDTAYVSANDKELYYSPSPTQPARLILRLGRGDYFDLSPPVLGPGYLGWGTSQASYLASTASLAVARVSAFGAVRGTGNYVWVLPWTGSKSTRYPWRLVAAATVNALTCARARGQASPNSAG